MKFHRHIFKTHWKRAFAVACATVPLVSYFACQKEKGSELRIIGGFEVNDQTSFGPLMESTVAITDAFSLLRGKSFCSGTLIGKSTVLTAAHCFSDDAGNQTKGDFYIFFGNRVGKGGSVSARQIVSIARHPKYDPKLTVSSARQYQNAFDIAVVKFSGNAPEGYRAAQVATPDTLIPRSLLLAGYGTTGSLLKNASGSIVRSLDGTAASVSDTGTLRAVQVALSRTFTQGAVFFVTSSDGSAKGACPGDSGGPAYYKKGENWVVGGALSTGLTGFVDLNGDGEIDANCTGQNFYTDVRAFNAWIAQTQAEFGDAEPAQSPEQSPEQPPEQSEKVYWVTGDLGDQLNNNSAMVNLLFLNDTLTELTNCSAVVEIDSQMPFYIWTLKLKDTLRTTTAASLPPGQSASLSFDRTKLSAWDDRKYTQLSAKLTCSGKHIHTQVLERKTPAVQDESMVLH